MGRDANTFKFFGERESKTTTDVERSYVSFDFQRLINLERGQYPAAQLTLAWVLITDNLFSFDFEVSVEEGAPIVVTYTFKRADNLLASSDEVIESAEVFQDQEPYGSMMNVIHNKRFEDHLYPYFNFAHLSKSPGKKCYLLGQNCL